MHAICFCDSYLLCFYVLSSCSILIFYIIIALLRCSFSTVFNLYLFFIAIILHRLVTTSQIINWKHKHFRQRAIRQPSSHSGKPPQWPSLFIEFLPSLPRSFLSFWPLLFSTSFLPTFSSLSYILHVSFIATSLSKEHLFSPAYVASSPPVVFLITLDVPHAPAATEASRRRNGSVGHPGQAGEDDQKATAARGAARGTLPVFAEGGRA